MIYLSAYAAECTDKTFRLRRNENQIINRVYEFLVFLFVRRILFQQKFNLRL